MQHILAALKGTPWAIDADWLRALNAVAMSKLGHDVEMPDVVNDGHEKRYEASLAYMGARMPGSRVSTLRDGIACIPVFGPVFPRANLMTEMSGATSLQIIAADFRAAVASEQVDKILLVIDSPGGAVSGTAEFAALVAGSTKPVHAHVTALGASAAYWIASQAQSITIDKTAMLGSIGVAMMGEYQEEPDQRGYRQVDLVSSSAADKRPDLSTEEGRATVQSELDQIEKVFIADVAKGRSVTPAVVRAEFGGGGVKVGAEAVQAGMADRLDTLEGTLMRFAGRRKATKGLSRTTAEYQTDVRRRRANQRKD